jgi:ribosomal protein S3
MPRVAEREIDAQLVAQGVAEQLAGRVQYDALLHRTARNAIIGIRSDHR